jgi:hypothetical protein
MSDGANTPIVLAPVSIIPHEYGLAAMELDPRPRLKKYPVIDGKRRRYGPRSPGAASLTTIQGDKP